jgi:hypothetical protein
MNVLDFGMDMQVSHGRGTSCSSPLAVLPWRFLYRRQRWCHRNIMLYRRHPYPVSVIYGGRHDLRLKYIERLCESDCAARWPGGRRRPSRRRGSRCPTRPVPRPSQPGGRRASTRLPAPWLRSFCSRGGWRPSQTQGLDHPSALTVNIEGRIDSSIDEALSKLRVACRNDIPL